MALPHGPGDRGETAGWEKERRKHMRFARRFLLHPFVGATVVAGLVAVGWGARVSQGAAVTAPSASQTLTIGWNLETVTLDPVADTGNADE
jgi:hypothetical protein